MTAINRVKAIAVMNVLVFVPAGLFLLGLSSAAYAGSAMVQAMDEEVARNRALGKVPPGKQLTGSSCESAGSMFGETAYRCTVTWE